MRNPEAATLYLVHGWKIEGETLSKFMVDLAPEVIEAGFRLVFPQDQKFAVFGEVLAKGSLSELSALSGTLPNSAARERLVQDLVKMGLDSGEPLLWIVLG